MWQDISLPMLETLRRRLRALIKLIEVEKRPLVFTDFEDRLGATAEVAVHGLSVGTDMDAFRRKARHFLKAYENHIAILKLRRNNPLTASDLAELERIVRGLEKGEQKLEDAITCYERGTVLRRHCEAKLAEAEARVSAIVRHEDGSLATRDLA